MRSTQTVVLWLGEESSLNEDIGSVDMNLEVRELVFRAALIASASLCTALSANAEFAEDCNQNDIPDEVEIAEGLVFDTDENGVIDSCQAAKGDMDLDGVLDEEDIAPGVYNPGHAQEAPVGVSISQFSYVGTDFIEDTPLSNAGGITVEVPTVRGVQLYMNIAINGQWVVQNSPVFTDLDPCEALSHDMTYNVELPVESGTPLSAADVTVLLSPIGTDTNPAESGLGQKFTAEATEQPVSLGGIGPTRVREKLAPPIPTVVVIEKPTPNCVTTTKTNENILPTDLDSDAEGNSCAANAVGASFDWLVRTYGMDGPEGYKSAEPWVQEIRKQFDGVPNGLTPSQVTSAKRALVQKYKLPLTVEVKGAANFPAQLITPQDIMDEMCKGQDVEITYGYWKFRDNRWRRFGGHAVAMNKITKTVKNGKTTWTLAFVHDANQRAARGRQRWTVPLLPVPLELTGDQTPETAWVLKLGGGTLRVLEGLTAESPTEAWLREQALRQAAEARRLAEQAIIDAIEQALPQQLRTELLLSTVYLQRTLDPWNFIVNDRFSTSIPQQVPLIEIADSALNLGRSANSSAQAVKQQPVDEATLEELQNVIRSMEQLIESLGQFSSLVPSDIDFDDVPDEEDNMPKVANADQYDLNNDGAPDVAQLQELDCNNNGMVDDFETNELTEVYTLTTEDGDMPIFDTIVPDRNSNGVPDTCELRGDWNSDGSADFFDLGGYSNALAEGISPPAGDYSLSGELDADDLASFLQLLASESQN